MSAFTANTYVNSEPTVDASKLPIIPEATPERRRTLVLCFDGTGDQFDADNSNVVQFFSMLQKDNRAEQMVYYQAGIGTYTVPQIATPFYAKISQAMDAAIAWNLDAHLMDGYTFLMQNYQAGDKICIFGFSRGAYTARSLAGMIHKIGLLPACNHQQVPFAYKMYTRTDQVGWDQSVAFKKAFSVDVDIEFVGVWDTVCSVGLIPKRLPFVSSNTAIRYFRHAVSLDERRAKFKANLYNRPTEDEAKLGVQPGEMPKSGVAWLQSLYNKPDAEDQDDDRNEAEYADTCIDKSPGHQHAETDVLEVWFAGCHCDVGGGSVPNDTPHNLARIPLRWMIRQCFEAKTGIRFHTQALRSIGLDPAALYPEVKKRPDALVATPDTVAALQARIPSSPSPDSITASPPVPPSANSTALPQPPPLRARTDSSKTLVNGSDDSDATISTVNLPALTEEEEDLLDALCPIYDQLVLAPAWWTLEVLPMVQRYQHKDNTWVEELTVNLGRPRYIPRPADDAPLKVHRSVKVRMDAARGLVEPSDSKSTEVYKPRPELRSNLMWVA